MTSLSMADMRSGSGGREDWPNRVAEASNTAVGTHSSYRTSTTAGGLPVKPTQAGGSLLHRRHDLSQVAQEGVMVHCKPEFVPRGGSACSQKSHHPSAVIPRLQSKTHNSSSDHFANAGGFQ